MGFLSGKKLGYTFDNKNFHNVSLGQGQEVIAEQALDLAAKNGHWVILQVQYTHILYQHTHLTVVINIMYNKYCCAFYARHINSQRARTAPHLFS